MIEHVFFTSQGEVAKAILNAVAIFFTSGSGNILLWVTGMIGMFVLTCQFLFYHELRRIFWWLASFTVLSTVLIEGNRSIIVHDTTQPLNQHQVDHVPLGLAIPLSSITGISSYLHNKLEGIMHIPNDTTYEKTGMVWGSTIFSQMKEVQVNPELLQNWSRFLYQCAYPDIKLRHIYTYDQLANASDVLAFLTEKTKPEGGFARVHIKGANPDEEEAKDYPRCGTALRWLIKEFKKDAVIKLDNLYKYNANTMTQQIGNMQNNIQNTYKHFFDISATSQSIMMQNLAMNAIRDGFKNVGISKNVTASALNYTKTQGQMARTSSWLSIGVMAQEYIPMLHTILMLLMCCAFIPIVYMAFFPTYTLNIIKKYLGGFIWLGTWPMFFIFINYIMTTILATHLKVYTGGFGGITLSNVDAVESITWRYAGLAGWLIAFVPYLSRMLIIGAGNAMMGIATTMSHQVSSDAEKGAHGMSEGNYNLFNTSVGNHNMNHIAGHNMSLRPVELLGGATRTSLAGGMQTLTPTGQPVYDNQGVIDRQPFNFRSGESVFSGLSQTQSMYEKHAFASAQMGQQSYSSAINDVTQTSTHQSLKHYLAHTDSSSSSAQLANAYATVADMNQRFGMDKVNSISDSLSGEVGEKASIGFRPFGIGVTGYEKLSYSGSKSDATNNTSGISMADAESYRKAIDTIKGASQTDIETIDKATGVDQGKSLHANFNKAFTYNDSATKSYDLANQAGEAANYAKNHDFALSEDKMPDFKNYLDLHYGREKTAQWMGDIRQQKSPEFKQAQSDFVQKNSDLYLESYRQNKGHIQADTDKQIDQKSTPITQAQNDVKADYLANKKVISKQQKMYEDERQAEIMLNRKQYAMSIVNPYDYATYQTLKKFGLYKEGVGSKIPETFSNTDVFKDLKAPDTNLLKTSEKNILQNAQALQHKKDIEAAKIKSKVGSIVNIPEAQKKIPKSWAEQKLAREFGGQFKHHFNTKDKKP